MTPKASESVDRERQNIFSCEHENTLKSMEFPKLWTLIWHVTVVDEILRVGFKNDKVTTARNISQGH